MIGIENLWIFADCDTCMTYCKDETVKGFTDSNACEKFFSCVHREKCSKERQDSFDKERKDKMDKMFRGHPYDKFRKAVIDEVKLHLNIIDVEEVIDIYNYKYCKYVLKMPYNFHCSISFEMLDDYYICNLSAKQVGDELISKIRQLFLDATLNIP